MFGLNLLEANECELMAAELLHFPSVRPLYSINIIFQSQQKTGPNIYNTTGFFSKAKTLRRLLVYDVHLRNVKETWRERKGREALAIIDTIWLCLICLSVYVGHIVCRVQICFKYKVFVLEQFRIYTAQSLVQCLYWNVSLISVRKTGKKFQSGSFLQEMLPSLNTLISDSFHCVLVYQQNFFVQYSYI